MISAITAFFSNALGGIWGYVVAGILAASLSGYVVHRMDESTIKGMKLAASQAEVAAVTAAKNAQARADKITLDSAVAEAAAQQKIVTRTVTLMKEIPIHVSDNAHCITYGLVRLLNAAASGSDAVPVAAGEPDDACSPATWRSLAADLTDDYGRANQNAEQLNALEDWNRKQATASHPAP